MLAAGGASRDVLDQGGVLDIVPTAHSSCIYSLYMVIFYPFLIIQRSITSLCTSSIILLFFRIFRLTLQPIIGLPYSVVGTSSFCALPAPFSAFPAFKRWNSLILQSQPSRQPLVAHLRLQVSTMYIPQCYDSCSSQTAA